MLDQELLGSSGQSPSRPCDVQMHNVDDYQPVVDCNIGVWFMRRLGNNG